MKIIKIFFLSVFAFPVLFSGLTVREGQYVLKRDLDIEKAQDLLTGLDQEMEAFLKSKEHNMRLSEDYLKQSGQWEKKVQSLNTLKEKVMIVQNLFLEFRENVSEMISLDLGDSSYASAIFSSSNREITEWYVKYLKEMLFPREKGKGTLGSNE